jgi:hypothetical protein
MSGRDSYDWKCDRAAPFQSVSRKKEPSLGDQE